MTDLTSKTHPEVTYDETHIAEYTQWHKDVYGTEPTKVVDAEVLDAYYLSLNAYYEHEEFVANMYDGYDEDFGEHFDEFDVEEEEKAREAWESGNLVGLFM